MLKGKVAVITGSTSGIGEGYAKAFAAAGCDVLINGFGDRDKIQSLQKKLESQYDISTLYHPADMTKPDEIKDMIETADRCLGSVDILINNAGIQHVSPIEDFDPVKWDSIIAINLSSAFHTMRYSIPLMRKQGWGRIISTASAHALVASPHKAAYVAAKHGIAGLTKTVALEVAQDNITVNAICPGYVWTPLVEKQIPEIAKVQGISEEQAKTDVLLAKQPTKQFVAIDDVASYAVFLCSPAANNITGSMQSIDGGWTAH